MAQIEIAAATWEHYNANARGISSTDCVARSISLAFDIPYHKVIQELNSTLKLPENRRKYESYKYAGLYSQVIKKFGGSANIKLTAPFDTLANFVDAHAQGTYLVTTGNNNATNKEQGRSNHIVCVINGTIYDSWDSRSELAVSYYECGDGPAINLEDPVSNHLDELSEEALNLAQEYAVQYINKYDFPSRSSLDYIATLKSGYRIKFAFKFRAKTAGGNSYTKNFELPIVFTPTDTLEAARAKMPKVIKQKMYDYFWTINKAYQEQLAADELANGAPKYGDTTWLYGQEKVFYKSLPKWCQHLIKYLNVCEPGQFSDSYQLRITPLPDDPDKTTIEFTHYDASAIRDMLNRYYTKRERPFDDYDPYEEY